MAKTLLGTVWGLTETPHLPPLFSSSLSSFPSFLSLLPLLSMLASAGTQWCMWPGGRQAVLGEGCHCIVHTPPLLGGDWQVLPGPAMWGRLPWWRSEFWVIGKRLRAATVVLPHFGLAALGNCPGC